MYMRILLNIIRFIADTLFPPSQDALLVQSAKEDELVHCILKTAVRSSEALLPFRMPVVRAAIHEAKFHGSPRAFTLLGNVLHEQLLQLPKRDYLLIPLPLSASRLRERGFNQAAEIAKAGVLGLPHTEIREDILKRTRNTNPQTKLAREARLLNMKDAFRVVKPDVIANRHVILIDDVVTTGATLDAAKSAIMLHSPASLTVIALAH